MEVKENCFRSRRLLGLDSSYEKMESLVKSERSPHALLILGEKGAGKRTFALHFAMSLLCREGLCPCFSCISCRKAVNFNHPDIIYAERNEKTGSIGVDEIRRLRRAASKVPQESQKKVFIIEEAQNLTVEAQNAFLKILEEPPEDTVFILTCSKEEALLETVISRLTLLCLPVIKDDIKKSALSLLAGKSEEKDISLASGVFPTVGQALDVLTKKNMSESFKKSLELTEFIKKKNRYGMLCLLSKYNKTTDRESLKELLGLTIEVCLYECKKGRGIDSRFMNKIDKSLVFGLMLLENNVNTLSVGAEVTERICA